jgi:hypothetical protein
MGIFAGLNLIGLAAIGVIFFIIFGWSTAVVTANPLLILVIIAFLFFWFSGGRRR